MENNKVVLLVEDDIFVSDIYFRKFTQEGYHVELAGNGVEAMEKLDKITPDIILLDIVMPQMDGREVLAKIKKDEKLSKIPVIMLTNLSEKDEVDSDFKIGADKYLIKSHFSPSEVVEKVEELLESKKEK